MRLALALALAFTAAPRPRYGGEIGVVGRLVPTLAPPGEATCAEALVAASQVFETLYVPAAPDGVVPRLAAALPTQVGARLAIPLRRGVLLHSGEPLLPAHVAASLRAAIATAAHPALAEVLAVSPGDGAVELTLADAEAAARVVPALASPRLAVVVPGPTGPLGTGPFFPTSASAEGGLSLSPFAHHYLGRPFVDAVVFRRSGRLSADRAWLLVGVDPGPTPRPRAVVEEEHALAVGPALAPLEAALSQAIGRRALARRISERARTIEPAEPSGPAPPLAGRRALLTVLAGGVDRREVAERIQLELVRAGLAVVLAPRPVRGPLGPEELRLEVHARAGEEPPRPGRIALAIEPVELTFVGSEPSFAPGAAPGPVPALEWAHLPVEESK